MINDEMRRSRDTFIKEIRGRLISRTRHQYRRPKKAGILLPFIFDRDEPHLLLTRRTEHMSNHRGEVAFPGGMMDGEDVSIVDTALRESQEEVGLSAERVEVIGQLDDLISKNGQVMVTPCIGVVSESPLCWRPNPSEVARVFEIPLSQLYRPELWRTETKQWRGRSFQLYYFDFDGEVLWGLSAYATLLALDLTERRSPIDLSDYYRQIDRAREALNRSSHREREGD